MDKFKVGKGALPSLDTVSIHDLRRRVKGLRNLKFEDCTQEQIRERVAHILDCYPMMLSNVEINGVWRARLNKAGETYGKASELWYPPAQFINRRGRLNDIKESRFYCASAPHTAAFEIRPEVGDTFTLLLARPKAKVAKLSIAFIGAARSLDKHVRSTRNEEVELEKMRQHLGNGNFAKFRMVDDLLSGFMTEKIEDESRYKPTIALATMLLDGAGIDGIHYPSVSTRLKGVNMTMSTAKADELLVAEEAWMMHIEGYYDVPGLVEPQFGMKAMRRSGLITPEGQIFWRPEGEGVSSEEFGQYAQIQNIVLHPWQMPQKRKL